MPKRYPSEFRCRVLGFLEAGRSVTEVARDLGIPNQTIDLWRRQEAIDKGLVAGPTSTELAELAAARQRIAELETELSVARRAMELLREGVPPKGVSYGLRGSLKP
jgi:transposase